MQSNRVFQKQANIEAVILMDFLSFALSYLYIYLFIHYQLILYYSGHKFNVM